MSAHGYIIGADGGGSKTAMLLARTDGSEVARLTAGASNPTDLGIENSASFLTETVARLCAENGVAPEQVRAVFLGVAGGSHEGFCALTNEKLHRLFPNAKTAVSHDAVNIVYAAFPEEDGAAVICGTGCSCYVRKGDVLHRIGGYSIFDVAGNGYEIGKRAVSHALACVDGRAEPDALYALVRDYTGEDLLDALPRLLRSSKTEIARYAPLVFEAERRGSAAAGIILRENIARIAEYINAAARYFDASFPAAIAGGHLPRRAGDGAAAADAALRLPRLRPDARAGLRRGGKGAAAVDKRLTGVYNNREETKIAGAVRISGGP